MDITPVSGASNPALLRKRVRPEPVINAVPSHKLIFVGNTEGHFHKEAVENNGGGVHADLIGGPYLIPSFGYIQMHFEHLPMVDYALFVPYYGGFGTPIQSYIVGRSGNVTGLSRGIEAVLSQLETQGNHVVIIDDGKIEFYSLLTRQGYRLTELTHTP